MTSARALPPQAFLEAFPCHLWLDSQLRVVQAGEVLRRLVPSLVVGAAAFESLTLACPVPTTVNAQTLSEHCDRPFMLEHSPTGLRLRGQLMPLEDSTLVLLLAPWIGDAAELERWGSELVDFPGHSAMPEQQELFRRLHESVERQEQRRRAEHLHRMSLAVIDWDTNGRIIAWNPAATKIFGISAEEATGRGIEILGLSGLVDEPKSAAGSFELLELLDRRVLVEHETRAGARLSCAWHNTLLVDVDGEPFGVSSVLCDVTQSVRAEQATRETQKLESLGLVARGVAHDFNNLLAAVLGNAELGLAYAEPSSSIARHLREITGAAERASELTKKLLDCSGRGTYELEPILLAELVAQMQATLTATVADEVRLVIREHGELLPINGDPRQLRQMIMNLIVNASEALGERGGEIRVSTKVVTLRDGLDDPAVRGGPLEPGTYVRLEIDDDGVGMSPELLSRIFEPFFSTKFTGRGLGLAATLGIVRGHRGALRVESVPGRGTRFELLFPALAELADEPDVAPRVAALRATGKGRVLIVDDEALVRQVLTTALASAGFDVVAAAAGSTALELYDSDPKGFDLVLTDLTMPGLDGHELFSALTARNPRLPVILSSGYSERRETARYPDGRPATFLKKPYRLGRLLAKVHEELGKRAG